MSRVTSCGGLLLPRARDVATRGFQTAQPLIRPLEDPIQNGKSVLVGGRNVLRWRHAVLRTCSSRARSVLSFLSLPIFRGPPPALHCPRPARSHHHRRQLSFASPYLSPCRPPKHSVTLHVWHILHPRIDAYLRPTSRWQRRPFDPHLYLLLSLVLFLTPFLLPRSESHRSRSFGGLHPPRSPPRSPPRTPPCTPPHSFAHRSTMA